MKQNRPSHKSEVRSQKSEPAVPFSVKVEALPRGASAVHAGTESWVHALLSLPRLKGLKNPSFFLLKQRSGQDFEIFVRVNDYNLRGGHRVCLVCSLGFVHGLTGLARLAIEVQGVPLLTGGRWYHFKTTTRGVRYIPVNADEEI